MKKLPFIALAFILVASIAIAGCGGAKAEFQVSDLTITQPDNYVGTAVTISAVVSNVGGASGDYTATLTISGAASHSDSEEVTLDPDATQTVTFTYTPAASGSYTVSIGDASRTFGVIDAPTADWWDVNYEIVGGGMTLRYSLLGTTPVNKFVPSADMGGTMTIRFSTTVTNGYREMIVLRDGFQIDEIFVPNIQPGINMTVDIPLAADATGRLYVEDGVGRVDWTSESTTGRTPQQVDVLGPDTGPAGSAYVPLVLDALAKTAAGNAALPFNLVFTTGYSRSEVSLTGGKKLDGSVLESTGVPFARDGGKAPYTGTAGTLTTTGTGDCLNAFLIAMWVDFQTIITLELEPLN